MLSFPGHFRLMKSFRLQMPPKLSRPNCPDTSENAKTETKRIANIQNFIVELSVTAKNKNIMKLKEVTACPISSKTFQKTVETVFVIDSKYHCCY